MGNTWVSPVKRQLYQIQVLSMRRTTEPYSFRDAPLTCWCMALPVQGTSIYSMIQTALYSFKCQVFGEETVCPPTKVIGITRPGIRTQNLPHTKQTQR